MYRVRNEYMNFILNFFGYNLVCVIAESIDSQSKMS